MRARELFRRIRGRAYRMTSRSILYRLSIRAVFEGRAMLWANGYRPAQVRQ